MSSTPEHDLEQLGIVARWRAWWAIEPHIVRWKVLATIAPILLLLGGVGYQQWRQNLDRAHDLACQRAAGRADVVDVLHEIVQLSDVFGDAAPILLYETSRDRIIDSRLPPIIVANCQT